MGSSNSTLELIALSHINCLPGFLFQFIYVIVNGTIEGKPPTREEMNPELT